MNPSQSVSAFPIPPASTGSPDTGAPRPAGLRAASGDKLTPEQHAAVEQLAATDRHVRAHEQAHLAAAGPYATSGASYTLVTGPDGQQYAVAGEVRLDVSPVSGDPQATIAKARVIEAAANAPVDPSPADRAVASAAAAMEQAAQQQLAKRQHASAAASHVKSAYGHGNEKTGSRLSLDL